MKLPLANYRILSVEQYGAGPYSTMLLAQLGADVVKVEPPGAGDTARSVGPHFLRPGESIYFQSFNLNKRSLTLDLNHADGRAVLQRLAADAHAVANNLRGDLPARMGLDYAGLKGVNPAIVCAHLSAYGRDNERARWPGYDYLMQAEAGFMSMTGEPDAPPTRFGLSMVDFMTGAMLAVGLLAALLDAERSGEGRDVDIDLLSTAIHQTSYPAMWYMNEADAIQRAPRSAHPSVTPSQMVRASDGWIFVMAQLPKFWTVLTDRIGRTDLAKDERFRTPENRLANRTELTEILDEVFSTEPVQHWLDLLEGYMPVAPVYSLAEALDNPFLQRTGMLDSVSHPDRAELRVLANPIRLDGARVPNRAGPLLGADSDAVLAEVGYTQAEITRLRSDGVV